MACQSVINSCLKSHFMSVNLPGLLLIILDSHTFYTNSVDVLDFCEQNDIALLCLPAHTTHILQPLDRSFFKSLKAYYYTACNNFLDKPMQENK